MPEWFRRTTWSEHDKADFERRLARARPANRAQYLRIQGLHLAGAGLHEPAIALLRRLLRDDPQPLQVAPALSQLSHSLLETGAVAEALEVLRECISREREYPNVSTDAWLDFAFTVARLRLSELYDEALSTLEHAIRRSPHAVSLPFPVQRFMLHASRAIFLSARGAPGAAEEARKALDEGALETSGFHYHTSLGLVGERHAEVQRRLLNIVG